MTDKARDAQIEAQWYSDKTVDEIAAEFILGRRQVRRIWQAAREEGRLPDGVRPHVASRLKQPIDPETGAPINPFAERAFAHDRAIADLSAHDPLLAALRREHGNDPRRAHDTVLITDRKYSHPPAWVANEMRRRDAECRPSRKRSKRI